MTADQTKRYSAGNVLISARSISKNYQKGSNFQTVLDRVSLDIRKGDFTVIMGPSGAGKSTLLHVLSGMDCASTGSVGYGSIYLESLDENRMAALRRSDFGFVFQQSRLVSNLTLQENVEVAGYLERSRRAHQTREHASQLLNLMGVGAAGVRLPSHVSGGEAQRASIARAVVNDPAVLFADEPTGSLNRANSEGVLDLFTTLNRNGQSVVMVTHDQRAALRGNRVVFLVDGTIAGDLLLPAYGLGDSGRRETHLADWLTQMGW